MKGRNLIVVALLLVALFYWAFSSPALPGTPRFTIPLEALRAHVAAHGNADQVTAHQVAEAAMPAFVSTAWSGFESERRIYTAFEVETGGETIMIDAPHPEPLHSVVPGAGAYFPDHYKTFEAALEKSDRVIISHIHGDHVAGVPFAADPLVAARKLYLNQAQHSLLAARGTPDEPDVRNMGFPIDLLEATQKLKDADWQFIAPGVAVIANPGHTPGHQLVYIATETFEILLLGDLVWTLENVSLERSRPRIIGRLIVGEDTAAVADQLAAVIQTARANTGIILIPSHDPVALDAAAAAGAVTMAGRPGQ